jgi:hypothetical protein
MNEPPSVGEMLNKLIKLPSTMNPEDKKNWLGLQYETLDPWMATFAISIIQYQPKPTFKILIYETKP